MSLYWEADQAKPGAPSSMDILMRCLLRPGMLERWQSNRTQGARKIVKELESCGINHRSCQGVIKKIGKMKEKYEAASKWLERTKQFTQYRLGLSSEEVERKVQQRCPRYRELATVFQQSSTSYNAMPSQSTAGQTRSRENICSESVREDGMHTGQRDSIGPSKRRRILSVEDETRLETKANAPEPLLPTSNSFVHVMGTRTADRLDRCTDDDEQNEIKLKVFHDSGDVFCLGDADETMGQWLQECEVEHKLALAKCELEAERNLMELRAQRSKVILRHKLLKAGVPKEAVDRDFPL